MTLGGFNGDFAPLDPQGFTEFARRLPTAAIYNLIKDAEPLGDPQPFRFPANQRRRYERLTQFPEGYLVFGDALCSFNLVYGQGMTEAAHEAVILQQCLDQGRVKLDQRFFTGVTPIIDGAGSVAFGNDLRLPHVEGRRTRMDQFIN